MELQYSIHVAFGTGLCLEVQGDHFLNCLSKSLHEKWVLHIFHPVETGCLGFQNGNLDGTKMGAKAWCVLHEGDQLSEVIP